MRNEGQSCVPAREGGRVPENAIGAETPTDLLPWVKDYLSERGMTGYLGARGSTWAHRPINQTVESGHRAGVL